MGVKGGKLPKSSLKTLKPEPEHTYETKDRHCLMCRELFASSWPDTDFSKASVDQGYQSTGLLACCSRYGLDSSASRLGILANWLVNRSDS